MHIISLKRLREFWAHYPDAELPLREWYRTATRASWQTLAETRRDYSHADKVGRCTVFNIRGNHYRIITKIFYDNQTILVRCVLTHREYDKEVWKNDC